MSTSTGLTKDADGFTTTPVIDISEYPVGFSIKLSGINWAYLNSDNETISSDGYAYVISGKDGYSDVLGYIKDYEDVYYGYKIECSKEKPVEVIFTTTESFKNRYSHIRFCGKGISTDAVVEVIYEQEIDGGTETKWTNTGHTFIPSDYEERIIDLEEGNEGHEVRITRLENLDITGTPNYIITESEEVVEKVLAVRNAYSFIFGAASDLHTTGNDTSAVGVLHMGMALNKIQSLIQLDLMVIFGDVMVGYFDDTYKTGFSHVKKCFSEVAKVTPFIQMQGNHDQLMADTTEQAQQKYFAYIGANNVNTITDWNNRYRIYGYKDFEDQKIRFIYLNSADVSENENENDCYITSQQLQWFVNVALDFSNKSDVENWSFVVGCHHPLNWNENISNLLTLIDAYNGKKSGSITLDDVTVAYDFANVKAEFIAHFHGHIHNFRVETLGANSVLSITIPNGCFDRNNEYGTYDGYSNEVHTKYGDTDENGNQRQFNKSSDSAEDTAFNIVMIDRQNRKIHCFNYGAGIDREVLY